MHIVSEFHNLIEGLVCLSVGLQNDMQPLKASCLQSGVLYGDKGELVKGQPQGWLSQITPVWQGKESRQLSCVALLNCKRRWRSSPSYISALIGHNSTDEKNKKSIALYRVHNVLHVRGILMGTVRSSSRFFPRNEPCRMSSHASQGYHCKKWISYNFSTPGPSFNYSLSI